jgi:tetratricopeptide (TPR) repeat protein
MTDGVPIVQRNAIGTSPNEGGLHHALGLSLVRLKRLDEALIELHRAADLDANNARYASIYGVALYSTGRQKEALAQLKESMARHPADRDIVMAIVSFSREAGDTATALQYAEQAAKIAPDDPADRSMLEEVRRETSPR